MAVLSAQNPQSTPQLEHALYYAALGWSVVPAHKIIKAPDGRLACSCEQGVNCVSKGKHPAIGWTKYQTERASETQIKQWFLGPYKQHGVGIITGTVSGIFVVDVDEGQGKPGTDSINNLQMIYGDLPITVQARTGGGGRHLIFKHPGTGWIATAKNVLGPGVDVRGDGGFIVAAPSLHESGRMYLWDENFHPYTTGLEEAPDWLLDIARSDSPPMHGHGSGHPGKRGIHYNEWGKVNDGREEYMVGIICGVIASMCQKNNALPSPEDVFAEAWPTYERRTETRGESLEADGRGESLMRHRIGHFLRRASNGKWKIKAPFAEAGSQEAGGSAEQPGREQPEGDGTAESARPSLPLVYFEDVYPNLETADFVEDLLIEASMGVVYGESNCGKTFFMSDLGMHVALGRSWRGKQVELGGVIYCALEGYHGISNRLSAFRLHYDLGPLEVPFAVIPSSINMLDEKADTDKLIQTIKAAAERMMVPVRLVIIDTLSRALSGGNENSPDDMGALVNNTDKVRQATKASVIFVHHSGKDAAKGARGHSLLRAATDTEIEISREDKDSPSVARVTKQRELDVEGEFRFRLQVVELGINRRKKPVTSCVVIPIEDEEQSSDEKKTKTSGQRSRVLPPNAEIGLRALKIALGKSGAYLPHTPDYPANTIAVSVTVWRAEFYQLKADASADTQKHAFHKAQDVLLARNIITSRNTLVWLVRGDENGTVRRDS